MFATQSLAPILFTATEQLSEGVLEAIQGLGATKVTILGGVAAVSQAVEDTLTSNNLATDRRAGDNRFEKRSTPPTGGEGRITVSGGDAS